MTTFPKFDRKPVSETIEEIDVERRAEARALGVRRILVGIVGLVTFVIGVSTDSWTYTVLILLIAAAIWGVGELIVHRDLGRLREARHRRKGKA